MSSELRVRHDALRWAIAPVFAVFALCLADVLPAGAEEAADGAPNLVRPEASGMGEGGWMDTTGMARPEGSETAIDADGIRQVLEAQLVAGVVRPKIDLNIEFELNSAELTPTGRRDLDEAGAVMSRHFREKRFVLGGHTDASGPADYNLALSRLRAQSARNYLIEVHAIEAERLDAKGYGESQPIDSGPPEKNRRVVLELLR